MSVSAVTQGTLGGCCVCWPGMAEGAVETAGGGLGLEETVRNLSGKGALSLGPHSAGQVSILMLLFRCWLLPVPGTVLWALVCELSDY